MNANLNMSKKNPNFLLDGTPLKNLNMARINLKNEEHAQQYWFLKRLKLALGGQITNILPYLPKGNFNENDGAPNGKRTMKALKEKHHLNKEGPKVK
jgi:hypothetical protein